MDITLLEQAGVTPWESQGVEYETNPRNNFKYFIKFLRFHFDDENKSLTAYFRVIRFALQNGDWVNDISYIYDAVVNESTFVDKYGNIVPQFIEGETGELDENENPVIGQIPNPEAWGTEFKRMQILFNFDIKDSIIVEEYQQILFDRGNFDYPKHKSI